MKNVLAVAVVLLGCSTFAAEPKRDPFQRPALRADEPGQVACRGASCRLDADGMQVVGVVSGTADPKAMVEDGAGNGFVLRRNSPVGGEGARVERISGSCVYVVRFFHSGEGTMQKQSTPYCLGQGDASKQTLDYATGELK